MKQLLDFLPLIIFFAVYKLFDIYIATGVLVAATTLQLLLTYIIYRKVEKMLLFTFAMVVVFGTLTLVFHNDAFIKWKVTIINWLFAAALAISHFMNKPLIKVMLGKEISVKDEIWTRVTWFWVSFFMICSLANLYIAFQMSQEAWVNFKVFGLTGATLICTIFTVFYLFKHIPEEQRKELK
ncbi:septation protein A [Shewanella avicenniae]|uniref:Inner membrane-spanning protein YciB n=1 Tax=Shewanella avicenniae TaxID=2814294 RepID=A0ABX7QMP1_9GAMM|nr:septation protein A [Shewanella avicenniae]QSX32287.1 septation protein A [Shewanella avicenniae]